MAQTKGKTSTADKVSKAGKVVEKVGTIFETLFGPATSAPTSTAYAGRVGGAPASLATPPPGQTRGASISSAPQAPVPGPRAAVVPGGLETGFEFRTPGGRNAAIVTGLISNVSKAITSFRDKKDADNIAKAQNWLNVYKNALEQGDTWTANLYASDPKIVQAWEKYLKLDMKKVPGQPTTQVTAGRESAGIAPITQNLPAAGGLGDLNMPGGIAAPRPSGDAELHAMKVNALLEMGKQDPEKLLAMTTPRGELAAVSGDEFRTAIKSSLGLELTPLQERQLSERSKLALMDMRKDILQFVMGEETKTLVATIGADASKYGADSRLQGIRERIKSLEKLSGEKADAIEGKLLLSTIDLYDSMVKINEDERAKLVATGSGKTYWKGEDTPELKALDARIALVKQKRDTLKTEYEANKLLEDILKD